LTDITDKLVADNEEKKMTNKYRKMFEQSIVGLAFYDSEGHLLTTNLKLRKILNFQSENDPFYYENTLYDMPTFRQVIEREIEGEYYFCSHSIIPERNVHCYTELRLHPIYDVNGQLQFITLAIRDITQERELDLQNRQNDIRIRQANEAIQDYENELQYLMDTCDMRFFRTSLANRTCTFYKQMNTPEVTYSIDEVISHFIDSPFKEGLRNFEDYFNVPRTDLTHMYSFFHESEELSWNYIDSVPSFDSEGHLVGTYGIVRNVTPLIEKQEQLKRETERANQSGMMKSTFMANMTHEIRTPLNAIVGFSDVLPMLSTPEEKKEIIHVIMNNCDMLLRLINDMLAVSELDESGISIQPADTDFAQDFNDICTTLAQRVQLPNVAFIKDNPYNTLKTRLDRERINQIITNFVTNAIKYTQQGHIKVGYEYREDDGGGLYIYCEDTGTGIKPEDQSKIFDRFGKLNDYVQGTGLGLNISKAIAEGCHGRIGINSEGEGKGSTFWVWIPCQRK
jgi:signal transduction histidine kinase